MRKSIFYVLQLVIIMNMFSCNTNKGDVVFVEGPSGNLSLKVEKEGPDLSLLISKKEEIMVKIELDTIIKDTTVFGKDYNIGKIEFSSENNDWKPVYGERKEIKDSYNQIIIPIISEQGTGKEIKVICRVYDEGIAFRYLFNAKNFENINLSKETTSFSFDNDYSAWVTSNVQGLYTKTNINNISNTVERPLVIKKSDSSYLAIGEAGLVEYARAKLKKDPQRTNTLLIDLEGEVNLKKAGYVSPWRYVIVGNSPGQLLENNYLLENLNKPNKLEDISWIRPGKVIREVTLTTKGGLACVDFAVKHNLQYVEFDAGWYGHEYEDSEDATTITVDPKRSPGPLDLHKVIAYGKERGIGILLYINQRAMSKQLDEALSLYESWGIAGVKYGFVNVGSQESTIWLHEAVRKAAKHHLMVDIHDEYRPTGFSRTYPNLITQEGIRGDEESPSVSQSITTLFTRMLAGAGDNTNCYLASRVSEKMGGKTAQMAKSIMLYSPWQFLYWYDRPPNSPHKVGGAGDNDIILKEENGFEFFDHLPVVWDETKVLESHMENYATVVRKKGETWFLGSLAANQERSLNLNFDFLDNNSKYVATIYSQGTKELNSNTVSIEKLEIDKKFIFNKKLKKDSGLAMIIRKK
ncbi:glycoside hydrolase family 97 catalytic domain-containing protein [Maribacter sp. ANRC-HE7]|uniref:Glycoside hydrolase family 97 catalytic domain-containing protein n=1 Tax=Maribacter aquimaris TaxID=2737171 RepID=A0ABR7UZ59_9FLAO|nr:glycoside hydrolase family 97 protein [Maribacter aquimaris]MBD0777818.1 glycoside hydrolase family 97 catalytic domain-containing protein [Maribacter aquimaris]